MNQISLQELYQLFLQKHSVSIDSRTIEQGAIFFCLKGPNFNAHKFIPEIIEKGASAIVIDEEIDHVESHIPVCKVENVVIALQELAREYRRSLENTTFLAITGSNGKTTHKELLLEILTTQFRCQATKGNLNNHLGVPLTLLSLKPNVEFAIIEMGANHMQEIKVLCEIAEPDYGFITNIGKAHIGEFGSQENIIQGKLEMAEWIQSSGKKFFLNQQDPILKERIQEFIHADKWISIPPNDIQVTSKSEQFVQLEIETEHEAPISIKSNLSGDFQVHNLVNVITIAQYFQIALTDVRTSIEAYFPSDRRVQWIEIKDQFICNDAYNANPTSMEASIMSFKQFENKSILILGQMNELGDYSREEHKAIVLLMNEHPADVMYVGDEFFHVKAHARKGEFFKTPELLIDRISNTMTLKHYKYILLKGSRNMRLESILNIIK